MSSFLKKTAQYVDMYRHYPAGYELPSAWQQLRRPLMYAGAAYLLSEYLTKQQQAATGSGKSPVSQPSAANMSSTSSAGYLDSLKQFARRNLQKLRNIAFPDYKAQQQELERLIDKMIQEARSKPRPAPRGGELTEALRKVWRGLRDTPKNVFNTLSDVVDFWGQQSLHAIGTASDQLRDGLSSLRQQGSQVVETAKNYLQSYDRELQQRMSSSPWFANMPRNVERSLR